MNIIGMIEYLVKTIADKPDQVRVSFVERDAKKTIQVLVASSDLPRVIGSEGRIFRALRSLVWEFGKPEAGENCDLVIDAFAQ